MTELNLEKSPQEHYATLDPLGFSGRIGRMRLLAWSLILGASAGIVIVLILLATKVSPTLAITFGATLTLAFVVVHLRINAQRLHDLNWSAWMLLLHLVPVANLVLTLAMLLMPGTPGPNKYGLPPPAQQHRGKSPGLDQHCFHGGGCFHPDRHHGSGPAGLVDQRSQQQQPVDCASK